LANALLNPADYAILMPYVLESMTKWDREIQIECLQALSKPNVVEAIKTIDSEFLLCKALDILDRVNSILYLAVSDACF